MSSVVAAVNEKIATGALAFAAECDAKAEYAANAGNMLQAKYYKEQAESARHGAQMLTSNN